MSEEISSINKDDLDSITVEAANHIAETIFNNVFARLDSSPEHQDTPDEEKRRISYNVVKSSLNSSYGSNLRRDLVNFNDLKKDLFDDSGAIIVTDEGDIEEPDGEDE